MQNPSQPIDSKFKISTETAIDLNILETFDGFTDIGELEQKAHNAGATITQVRGHGAVVGSSWDIQARIRKKQRRVTLTILEFQRPEFIVANLTSVQFQGLVQLRFKATDQDLTKVRLDLKATPKALSARLVLNGLRLTRHRQKRRLTRGLRKLCRHLEATRSAKS